MAEPSSGEITQLLRLWNDGDPDALEKLTPLVYRELHRLAARYVANERPGHAAAIYTRYPLMRPQPSHL